MNLLIVTQKINRNDPVLGFFHRWVEEFSKHAEKVTVICLEKGEYSLPKNVKVLTLGKEEGRSVPKYLYRFYAYLWSERKRYDSVFVHMNQEYILLGGLLWKVLGKRIYMWRNHHAGSFLTDIAIVLSNRVLYTSQFSYTARSKKSVQMPAGIDTNLFRPDGSSMPKSNSILFLGRISPIKKQDVFVEALMILKRRGVGFIANIYGDPLPKDDAYHRSLREKVGVYGLGKHIKFHKGVPNYKTPEIYRNHEIFVNLTPSGSLDKTIFEAMACGNIPVIVNKSLVGQIDKRIIADSAEPESIADSIAYWMSVDKNAKENISNELRRYVLKNHSLGSLVDKIFKEF